MSIIGVSSSELRCVFLIALEACLCHHLPSPDDSFTNKNACQYASLHSQSDRKKMSPSHRVKESATATSDTKVFSIAATPITRSPVPRSSQYGGVLRACRSLSQS